MLKNYLKAMVRNLLKYKFFSIINVGGLAIGLASVILIMLWVNDELSFDRFNTNGRQIYRVVSDWEKYNWQGFDGTPEPLATAVKEQIPEILDALRIASRTEVNINYNNKSFYENGGVISDPSLFKIFSFKFIDGAPETVFKDPYDVVITEKMAEKYFGNENPVGKILTIEGKSSKVTGIIENIPANSHLKFDFVSSFQFINNLSDYGTNWNAYNFVTYLMVKEKSNINEISRKITEIALKNNSTQVSMGANFRLQGLFDVYLHSKDFERSFISLENSTYIYAFSIIAVFILFIACINYINLTTARSFGRSREVGMRKTLGANRINLIRQFLGESVIISFIAGILAILLVELFIPFFNSLAGKNLSINFANQTVILIFAIMIFATGILSGLYPALILSSYKPVEVLKGNTKFGFNGNVLRRMLILVQFSLTISLIIGTIIIHNQMKYIQNKNLGFDKKNIIYLPIKGEIGGKYSVFKSRLLENRDVLSVSAQTYSLAKKNYHISGPGIFWEGKDQNQNKDIDFILSGIDYNLFNTINIQLKDGRYFSKEYASDFESGIILNEQAVKEMEIKSPVGKRIFNLDTKPLTIVGVVSDANFQSLHHKVQPMLFYPVNDFSKIGNEGIILVKYAGNDIEKVLSALKATWREINPDMAFDFNFLDDTYDQLYKKEKRTEVILNCFSILAIILSCMGLSGISSYIIEKRTKEIGIRKTLGASISSIIYLLSRQLILLVLLANFIAIPLAGYFMNEWLQNFAYRIDMNWWLFLVSGLIALIISLVTVGFQAIKAAIANPIKSLRYE
jgi:putative ABC transport system permease protein